MVRVDPTLANISFRDNLSGNCETFGIATRCSRNIPSFCFSDVPVNFFGCLGPIPSHGAMTTLGSVFASEKRLADYFVVCGLDLDSGLEPDALSGKAQSTFVVSV